MRLLARIAAAMLVACAIACSFDRGAPTTSIRITGSDTMVNLVQAWAEHYATIRPSASVQVAGGGSGVGIAGLINGTLDIAAASREMDAAELRRFAERAHARPVESVVALDALAIYVHPSNPLDAISLDELAAIYGEGGHLHDWSQLGVRNRLCRSDAIIRVGRQNSSGTYAYFRRTVLGTDREFSMGSIDQNGSKDVANLVARTPCAIGYSGMTLATAAVKVLRVRRSGGCAIAPSAATVLADAYPLARRLYLLTAASPTGELRRFIDWVRGPGGQAIVRELGFVPQKPADRAGEGVQ